MYPEPGLNRSVAFRIDLLAACFVPSGFLALIPFGPVRRLAVRLEDMCTWLMRRITRRPDIGPDDVGLQDLGVVEIGLIDRRDRNLDAAISLGFPIACDGSGETARSMSGEMVGQMPVPSIMVSSDLERAVGIEPDLQLLGRQRPRQSASPALSWTRPDRKRGPEGCRKKLLPASGGGI